MSDMTDLESAADRLIDTIRASLNSIRSNPSYADPLSRVAAHGFLVNVLISRLEGDISFDADYPYFRHIDPRTREGGDNPDQQYAIAKINGNESYRIWGRLGSATRLDVQVYAGDPYIPGRGGRSASFINFEDIEFDADGGFEINLSPAPAGADRPMNHLENPPDSTRVLVRQIFATWTDDDTGELHIDRVGHEGDRRPAIDAADMARRFATAADNLIAHVTLWPSMVNDYYIDRVGHEGDRRPAIDAADMARRFATAADNLSAHVTLWPSMVNDYYIATKPLNTVSVPIDPGSRGGVPGRWMANCVFDLQADEALVITTWPMDTEYQSLQLANLWFSSFEYANAQTSLTSRQSEPNPDGSYTYVVCSRDPGVNNWLDSMEFPRGVVMFRFDGMAAAEFDPDRRPVAVKVRIDDLDTHIDPGVRRVSPDERRSALAARRRHVQRRFGI